MTPPMASPTRVAPTAGGRQSPPGSHDNSESSYELISFEEMSSGAEKVVFLDRSDTTQYQTLLDTVTAARPRSTAPTTGGPPTRRSLDSSLMMGPNPTIIEDEWVGFEMPSLDSALVARSSGELGNFTKTYMEESLPVPLPDGATAGGTSDTDNTLTAVELDDDAAAEIQVAVRR